MFEYSATVIKVVDGDTIDLNVDLGFHAVLKIRTRLLGVNAPEVGTQEGRDVRDWLRSVLPVGCQVVVQTHKDPGDKYGRWLAKVTAPHIGDVATVLLTRNFAVEMKR